MKKGIDISKHNGQINWQSVSGVDFAIIRAGYGKNNIDAQLKNNVNGCKSKGIPFGFYWFSYATSVTMCRAEANYLCDLADKYHPTYPLCYDWEYDSDDNAKKKGVKLSNKDREEFAKAFLETVEARGYYAMIYSNIDYLNKGFANLLTKYDLWLASWSGKNPPRSCGIWQYTDKGRVQGILGNVDCNYTYKEYGTPQKEKEVDSSILAKIDNLEISLDEFFQNKYKWVLKEVYKGNYGTGNERKEKLKNNGYDPELVQALINWIEDN